MSDKYKAALRDLVDGVMACEAGREIDAGCDGEGPVAEALVLLGDYKTLNKATKAIYGAEY